MTRLILASSSPRRKEILIKANIPFTVIEPFVDETINVSDDPHDIAKELAKKKAYSVMDKTSHDDIILGVDTIVVIEGCILGKPCTKEEAKMMIKRLSNKTHSVISGVCIIGKNGFFDLFTVDTVVKFNEIEETQIDAYIQTDEPYDKAGAYAIQGWAAKFINKINGCYYNVMGLPLSKIYAVIKNML